MEPTSPSSIPWPANHGERAAMSRAARVPLSASERTLGFAAVAALDDVFASQRSALSAYIAWQESITTPVSSRIKRPAMQSRDEFLSLFSDAIDVAKLREIEVVGFGAPHMDRLIRRLHAERAADSLQPRAVRTREGAAVEAQTNHATPLHLAAAFGHFSAVRDLLSDERGCVLTADPNAVDSYGFTALHVAASRYCEFPAEQRRTIELLVDAGAEIGARSLDGWTPLHLAALAGAEDVMSLLRSRGAGAQAVNEPAAPPPVQEDPHPDPQADAAGEADPAEVPPPETPASLWTPMHCAAWGGHTEALRALARRGAGAPGELAQPDALGATPLHWCHLDTLCCALALGLGAAEAGEWRQEQCPPPIPAAETLRKARPAVSATAARREAQEEDTRPPPQRVPCAQLALPVRRSAWPSVSAHLKRRRASPTRPPAVRQSPAGPDAAPLLAPPSPAAVSACTEDCAFGAAFTALLRRDDALAAEIVAAWPPEPAARLARAADGPERALTLLHLACAAQCPAAVEALLGAGADADARTARGDTALHLAAEAYSAAGACVRDAERILTSLLAAGADADARAGADGLSPLHLATLAGAPASTLHLVVASGADPDARAAGGGGTPLHAAAALGDAVAVRALLRAGARADAADDEGRTALFEAVRAGDAPCVAVLVNLGADVNATDAGGWTALARGLQLVSTLTGCSKRLLLLMADNGAWDAGADAAVLMRRLGLDRFLRDARARFAEQMATLRASGHPRATPWAPKIRFAVPPQAQPACAHCPAEFGFFTPRVRPPTPFAPQRWRALNALTPERAPAWGQLSCALCGHSVCAKCSGTFAPTPPRVEAFPGDAEDWRAQFGRVLPAALLEGDAEPFSLCAACAPFAVASGACRQA